MDNSSYLQIDIIYFLIYTFWEVLQLLEWNLISTDTQYYTVVLYTVLVKFQSSGCNTSQKA